MLNTNAGLFLTNYVYQIPVFIVWVIGGIVAIVRWRRHPRPSLLLVVALSTFLLRALIGPIVTFSIVHSGTSLARAGMVNGLVSLASMLVAAVAWSLLLAAALGWRERSERAGNGS